MAFLLFFPFFVILRIHCGSFCAFEKIFLGTLIIFRKHLRSYSSVGMGFSPPQNFPSLPQHFQNNARTFRPRKIGKNGRKRNILANILLWKGSATLESTIITFKYNYTSSHTFNSLPLAFLLSRRRGIATIPLLSLPLHIFLLCIFFAPRGILLPPPNTFLIISNFFLFPWSCVLRGRACPLPLCFFIIFH